jgi:hypothetical protein
MRALGGAALLVWAVGAIVAEGISQVGALVCVALAVWLAIRGKLSLDVRRILGLSLLLSAWQAVSPAVALARGVADSWPKSGRYWQFLDTLAPGAAGAALSLGAPLGLLAAVMAFGWVASTAVALFQHFVRWPFGQPWWSGSPVERVQEAFGDGGGVRYAAGGLLFHRLRFAHGAVAMLGPALSVALRGAQAWRRWGIGLVACLLGAAYLAFARAALLAALAMGVLGTVWLFRGRALLAGALVLAMATAVVASPGWRARLVDAPSNLSNGERHRAMAAGLRMIAQHPLLGVGFGNHKPSALADARETGVSEFLANDSHDLWITTWAETGLLGVALTAAYHVSIAWALLRRSREGSWMAAGAILSWVGFQLLGLVHYLPYHTGVYLSFGLVWGLGLGSPAPYGWMTIGREGECTSCHS